MCLLTSQREPIILDKSMVVYKDLNYELFADPISTVAKYSYKKGEQPHVNIIPTRTPNGVGGSLVTINAAYHSWGEGNMYARNANAIFVIPKGAVIYKDGSNEIASSDIIYVGKRNWFTKRKLKKYLKD